MPSIFRRYSDGWEEERVSDGVVNGGGVGKLVEWSGKVVRAGRGATHDSTTEAQAADTASVRPSLLHLVERSQNHFDVRPRWSLNLLHV